MDRGRWYSIQGRRNRSDESWDSDERVAPDGVRQTAFVIGPRDHPSSPDALRGIAHDDGGAGEVEHLDVVQIVADRHHLGAPEPAHLRPPRQCGSLRAAVTEYE